ncbi:hypothetical protein [Streptococcus sp. 20-1249]|uniref:hypothetical protein n=1 Tax=Streptococcus hepaticus TaxID=3349163 RepID=UPI0037488F46
MKKKNSCLTVFLYLLGGLLILSLILMLMPVILIGGVIAFWYYTKKKPDPKKRNFALTAIIIGLIGSLFAVPSMLKNNDTNTNSSIQTLVSNSSTKHSKRKSTQENSQTKPSIDPNINQAETAVASLEQAPNEEQYSIATAAVEKVTDPQKKAELENRLALVQQNLATQEAETSVKYLEDHQERGNIEPAKQKISAVIDEAQRNGFENRISAVVTAIETREAQAAQQEAEEAAAAQEERIVYITGGGKSAVYWYSTTNMPHNTNMSNIITMSEAEAIRMGKRHSRSD